MKDQPKLRKTLTIRWKAHCRPPRQESFRNIKSIDAAKKILEKRDRENIKEASWWDGDSQEIVLAGEGQARQHVPVTGPYVPH